MPEPKPLKEVVSNLVLDMVNEMNELGPGEKRSQAAAIESLMRAISDNDLGEAGALQAQILAALSSPKRPKPTGPGHDTNPED
jgi:hypothetical protein